MCKGGGHSQEIIRDAFLLDFVTFPWSGVVLDVVLLEVLVNIHDGGLIVAAVAIVGGGEDSGDIFIVGGCIALHHELVSPRNHA